MPCVCLGTALKEKGSLTYEQTVADTLRIFGQGTKVMVEIVAMSADAGLIHSQMLLQ